MAVSAGSGSAHNCASPHTSGCDTGDAACAQHCAQAAAKLHDAAVYAETHFPPAICPHVQFLQPALLVAGGEPVADAIRTPYGGVPARLLYCSLQI